MLEVLNIKSIISQWVKEGLVCLFVLIIVGPSHASEIKLCRQLPTSYLVCGMGSLSTWLYLGLLFVTDLKQFFWLSCLYFLFHSPSLFLSITLYGLLVTSCSRSIWRLSLICLLKLGIHDVHFILSWWPKLCLNILQ